MVSDPRMAFNKSRETMSCVRWLVTGARFSADALRGEPLPIQRLPSLTIHLAEWI